MTGSLEEIFSVPQVALSLWDANDEFAGVARARDAAPELIEYVGTLAAPYCGMPLLDAAHALSLFHKHAGATAVVHEDEAGDGAASDEAASGMKPRIANNAADVRSVALIPLRRGAAPAAFGVLALGSADPRRFHEGMGTDFLSRIGETSSAALTRLLR